jgi:hypothetical protein
LNGANLDSDGRLAMSNDEIPNDEGMKRLVRTSLSNWNPHVSSSPSSAQRSSLLFLRIAVTAFFGVLTLLLVAMWRGSLNGPEFFSHIETNGISTTIESNRGWAYLYRSRFPYLSEVGRLPRIWYSRGERSNEFRQGVHYFCLPYGMMICLAVTGSVLPWLPLRFSLRTMLLATTLVATVLGLAVWAWR